MSAEMDKKTCRWKKFPLAKVFGPKDRKASSRGSMECSINSTVDFKDSPVESLVASSSASSSSFFKKFSENRSLKLSGFSTCTEAFRIFAATWNVAGQTPDMELNLNDLLPSDDHSDIYALGQAIEKASQNQQIVNAIGMPIVRGPWYSASIAVNHTRHSVSCTFPVSAPQGNGLLKFKAVHLGDESWFSSLQRRDWEILIMDAILDVPTDNGKHQTIRVTIPDNTAPPPQIDCRACKSQPTPTPPPPPPSPPPPQK